KRLTTPWRGYPPRPRRPQRSQNPPRARARPQTSSEVAFVRDAEAEDGGLPLPGEVVADIGVAVSGIKPQAPVKRKRVIQLIDLRAGIGDGRWNVNAGRWLGQRQRWCA